MEATIELAAALRDRGYRRRSRTCRRTWSATGPTSASCSGGWTTPGSTAPSSSAATPRIPVRTATACRSSGRWPTSGTGSREIGVPCYPQGHPTIPEDVLLAALAAKAPLVDSMTTQLCFDPDGDRDVAAGAPGGRDRPARHARGARRRRAAPAARRSRPDRRRATAARFVAKNLGFVARMVRSGGFYRPDGLLAGLGPLIADPAAGVAGLHLYTFNAVEATEAWRVRYLAAARARARVGPSALSSAADRRLPWPGSAFDPPGSGVRR